MMMSGNGTGMCNSQKVEIDADEWTWAGKECYRFSYVLLGCWSLFFL